MSKEDPQAKPPTPAFDAGTNVLPVQLVTGELADQNTHFEVSQLYFREARLLDDGRYTDWLDMFAEDLRYWMPVQTNRLRRQQGMAVSQPGETAYYDETKASLAWRIRRFDSGMAWAEDPPSRTRHLITNVVVTAADPQEPSHATGDLVAESNYLVYRTRLQHETGLLVGRRVDLLRRVDGRLQVCRRTILLDVNVLEQKNISTFF